MNIQKKAVLVPLAAALALGLGSDVAQAKDYTRSCSANYSVSPVGGGESWNFTFTGKGTVGYYNPNEARRRARHNIDECIDAHWDNINATGRPSACTESNQIYSYPVNSLAVDIQRNICRLNPGRPRIPVSINVTYNGQSGCTLRNNSWLRHVAQNYNVNCSSGSEFEQNTDRPGMDMRSFSMRPREGASACRDACIAESGCKAWTYVKARHQGPRPRCYLKSDVPHAVANDCCTSGVITELH